MDSFTTNSNEAEAEQPTQECQCARVLIVDDEPFNLLALEAHLIDLGVSSVEKALDAQQALQKVRENLQMRQDEEEKVHGSRPLRCLNHRPYRLIMMDQNMPIMGGIEGALQIRDMQRQGLVDPSVKIVLMSGDDAIIHENEDQGIFDRAMLKPLNHEQLVEICRDYRLIS